MGERLLRLPAVRERTGLSRSHLYQLMAEGIFPKPCSIGVRVRAWVASEVDNWVAARVDERDGTLRSPDTRNPAPG